MILVEMFLVSVAIILGGGIAGVILIACAWGVWWVWWKVVTAIFGEYLPPPPKVARKKGYMEIAVNENGVLMWAGPTPEELPREKGANITHAGTQYTVLECLPDGTLLRTLVRKGWAHL